VPGPARGCCPPPADAAPLSTQNAPVRSCAARSSSFPNAASWPLLQTKEAKWCVCLCSEPRRARRTAKAVAHQRTKNNSGRPALSGPRHSYLAARASPAPSQLDAPPPMVARSVVFRARPASWRDVAWPGGRASVEPRFSPPSARRRTVGSRRPPRTALGSWLRRSLLGRSARQTPAGRPRSSRGRGSDRGNRGRRRSPLAAAAARRRPPPPIAAPLALLPLTRPPRQHTHTHTPTTTTPTDKTTCRASPRRTPTPCGRSASPR